MRSYVILAFLLSLLDEAALEIISANASWNNQLNLACKHDQSLIFVKEALFGLLGENGKPGCTIDVGSHVRNTCNRRNSCKLKVIVGPFLNPKLVDCTQTPGLYVKHVCINKGASIMDMSQVANKWSGYVKPTDNVSGGYKSDRVSLKVIDELCPALPRSVQFELVDLDLAGDCSQEQLSIEVSEGAVKKTMGPFCEKGMEQLAVEKRVRIFSDITKVTLDFKTDNRNTKSRGFLLKFVVMQCRPVPTIPNTVVEYSLTAAGSTPIVQSRIRCGDAYVPWFETPEEVVASCDGNNCIYDCDDPSACNFGWKKGAIGATESRKMEDMKCVLPSALKTTTTTTTTTTVPPSTTPTTSKSSKAPTSAPSERSSLDHLPHPNNTVSAALPAFPPAPTRRSDRRQLIAGIIGGVVGIVACLIVGVLGLMLCRKTRFFNSPPYDKTSYVGSQAVSHDAKTFNDSTLALRYRPPSTISTQVPTGTLASVARSSAGSSILFPSNRRSKRKTLPHPSTLGYGPYDESLPFFAEALPSASFSPSVETYLEPDRRPSVGAPPPPAGLFTFPSKPSSRNGVYQIYDENRSSRNALDRCEMPPHQHRHNSDRHSMAMISNHYYCRGEGSNDEEASSDNSVYEVMEDGSFSPHSTPCESRRNFPAAARNDYVQPPELPARPATMRRSHQDLPAAPLAGGEEEEDEDGYQPVNCANRPTA